MRDTEHIHQVSFVNWFRSNYPEALIFAIPNGELRAISVANRLKAEGVVSGIPDLCILLEEKTIWIEMKKAKGGRVSKVQKEIHTKMQSLKHEVYVCNGFEEAKALMLSIASK